ncbi:MAG: O-antigen ligase family protein [Candidatus Omnitrophota bacterium]
MVNNILKNVLAWIVFLAVVLLSVGYSLFGSVFAEIFIPVPVLGWPLFVGEMVFLLALTALCAGGFLKILSFKQKLFWSLFFIWILIMAFTGFSSVGLLAFRHAAIFYYSFFMLVFYLIMPRIMISKTLAWVAVAGLTLLISFKQVHQFYVVSYFIVLVILLWNLLPRRMIFVFLLGLFVAGNPVYLLSGPRTHMIGLVVAGVFLLSTGLYLIRKRVHYSLACMTVAVYVGLVFLGMSVVNQADLKSMTELRSLLKSYVVLRQDTRDLVKHYVPEFVQPKYYNPDKVGVRWVADAPDVFDVTDVPARGDLGSVHGAEIKDSQEVLNARAVEVLREQEGRLSIKNANALFRLLIWRDMLDELKENYHWVAGFGFGKPLRSKTIEVLGWANSEWKRDGWIEPHNSFFHVLYRSGLLGFLLIGALFFAFGSALIVFVRLRAWQGVLLSAAVLYWLVAANFVLVLELPYYAIPFWSLCGAMLAYKKQLEKGLD